MGTVHAAGEGAGGSSPWRLAFRSAVLITVVGALYVAVIAAWLLVERTPAEPIGDPYLGAMEVLTLGSALGIAGLAVALAAGAGEGRRVAALGGLVAGGSAAVLTGAVHFVQLTAVRQLWRAGEVADYRLVWPSTLFAAEYLAWDVLVGMAMLLFARTVDGLPGSRTGRRVLAAGGLLCLGGVAGPLTGAMAFQNVAVAGYAVALPVGTALLLGPLGRVGRAGVGPTG